MTICSLPLLEAMPPWPAVTCSKASTLGSAVIRISARSATSKPTTSNPPLAKFRIVAVHMMPVPMRFAILP
jgi:hypothetical protein